MKNPLRFIAFKSTLKYQKFYKRLYRQLKQMNIRQNNILNN